MYVNIKPLFFCMAGCRPATHLTNTYHNFINPQISRSRPAQRTLSNDSWRPGSSNGPMIDIQLTTIILLLFYYYHYHHRYHYSYHNFIITILCYAPSVITCTVGGAIQMTLHFTFFTNTIGNGAAAYWTANCCDKRQCGNEFTDAFHRKRKFLNVVLPYVSI